MPSGLPRISLVVVEGPQKGKAFTFAGHDTFLVGRSRDAHFRLSSKDRLFSRLHFMIEVNPPACRLTDMGSRNGTFVNGKRVTTTALGDGDRIKAGQTVFAVKFEDTIAKPTVPSSHVVKSHFVRADTTANMWQDICRVCAAAIVAQMESPRFLASPWPLCDDCLAQLRRQQQNIPNYQIIRRLGKGGMGVVFLGLRIADGEVVAIKTVAPSAQGSQTDYERFLREADILRRLHHPNIVAFHEIGEAEGRLYFVMEYVPGQDAQQLLQSEGPMPLRRAVALIGQVIDALAYAHALGFVHRDLKPANILVCGEGLRAKLADFGLARVYQASRLSGLTLQGDLGGTAGFIAPEQIVSFRDAKPAADQYAAAATLYMLLTGQQIFDMPERFHDQILKVLHDEPVPLRTRRTEIPAAVAAVVHRALAKRPEKRFADVTAFRKALLDALA